MRCRWATCEITIKRLVSFIRERKRAKAGISRQLKPALETGGGAPARAGACVMPLQEAAEGTRERTGSREASQGRPRQRVAENAVDGKEVLANADCSLA